MFFFSGPTELQSKGECMADQSVNELQVRSVDLEARSQVVDKLPRQSMKPSTLVMCSVVALTLAGILGGAVRYRELSVTKKQVAVEKERAAKEKDRVVATVNLAYKNEHFNPVPEGKCWLPDSPAQDQIRDQIAHLRKLSALAVDNGLAKQPLIDYVLVHGPSYAEVGTTEEWRSRERDTTPTVRRISRTYFLKKQSGEWKVYRATPLPVEDLT
jgi:hypothetical protein